MASLVVASRRAISWFIHREQAEDSALTAHVENELLADQRADSELGSAFVHDVERFGCGMARVQDHRVFWGRTPASCGWPDATGPERKETGTEERS